MNRAFAGAWGAFCVTFFWNHFSPDKEKQDARTMAEANAFFTELGVPTTFLLTSFYWENLIHFGLGPKPGSDGTLQFTLPMGDRKLPGISSEDIGKCALGIFARSELIGTTVGVAGLFREPAACGPGGFFSRAWVN